MPYMGFGVLRAGSPRALCSGAAPPPSGTVLPRFASGPLTMQRRVVLHAAVARNEELYHNGPESLEAPYSSPEGGGGCSARA